MAQKSYEAIVIGAGPGGYPAGIRLGQLGVKSIVIEKEYMGGVCLNWGCIPSKALIAAANTYEQLRGFEEMGIHVGDVKLDVDKLQDWKGGIVKKLTGGIGGLLKSNGSESMMGTARIVSPRAVEVTKSDGSKETI